MASPDKYGMYFMASESLRFSSIRMNTWDDRCAKAGTAARTSSKASRRFMLSNVAGVDRFSVMPVALWNVANKP